MGTQINLKLSERMFHTARVAANTKGFDNLQDFIREMLREKLFEEQERLGGKFTMLASEKALAKHWLTKEEDEAWRHFAKEI